MDSERREQARGGLRSDDPAERRSAAERIALAQLGGLAFDAADDRVAVLACEALLRYAAEGYAGVVLDTTEDTIGTDDDESAVKAEGTRWGTSP